MHLYLSSLVAFATELGTGLRRVVQHPDGRPQPVETAGAWVIPPALTART